MLGALIGKLFGKKKPRIPTAAADVSLNLATTAYEIGNVTTTNNGNRSLVVNMASVARDSLNGLISGVVGGSALLNANTVSPTQTYSHNGNQIRARFMNGAWQNFDSADKAVDWGVTSAIQLTKIRGGDIFQKRAFQSPTINSVASLFGNMQIASDYGTYLRNRTAINSIIRDNPTSEIAAAWIVTLGRVDELGINDWSASDFYAGLIGFSESFGFGLGGANGALGFAYEDLTVGFEGSALRITAAGNQGPFALLSGSNNISNQAVAAQSAYIANFGSNVGYTVWTGQATAGNDVWVASGSGSGVTMDDTGTQWVGYWGYWGYYSYPVTVSGGDDIFVGSNYNDLLYGRTGWDWLDGGAGHDQIDGGDNDDVLLGGSGVDQLIAGTGNDYLAGGEDNDYVQSWIGGPAPGGLFGGDGSDILVGNGGVDALFGENGDDTFLVDQDGGGVWDYYDGGAGFDTVSFERFTFGVGIDLTSNRGGGYTAQTYSDGYVSIENMTGSQYNDWLYGDEVANVLKGLGGNDYLYGRDGNDVLEGGIGTDSLDGGNGIDSASYASSLSGVVVDLAISSGLGGDATSDTYSSIENIVGSKFNDEIVGSAGDNVLTGLAGDDIFAISQGADTIDGGSGLDLLDASGSGAALTVYYDAGVWTPYYSYPGLGWVATSGSGTTLFSSIEGFVGTSFADYLSGDAGDEVYQGGGGNDSLYGSSGSDTYVFERGDGQDSITESSDGANEIALGSNINWRDVAISGAAYYSNGGNLVVSLRGTSDQIVVGGNFSYVNSGTNAGNHNHAIKSISLGGASTIDIDMIDYTPVAADEAGTVVYGAQNQADIIFAYGGADVIYAAGSSTAYETRGNVIYAGDGNDTIYGSYGDDQYIFEVGNGVDTLTDIGGLDTIVMGPSVAADDVIYEIVPTGGGASADLYIGIRNPSSPTQTASQVADRIRVVDGGLKLIGTFTGNVTYSTTEYVRVGSQEIDLTKANLPWVESYYYDGGWYWPVALDLDGDGIELRSVEGSRIASVEADGTITRMGWLGQDDGFLALDRNGDGAIDRIGEISFIGDVEGAKSDLEGLAAYDSSGDGKLDASDKRWGEFRVWQDKNQDGFGAKKELVSLDEAGVRSISLKGQASGFTQADGLDNVVLATSDIEWADGKHGGSAHDVALARLQVRTDGGDKALAQADAAAKGRAVDPLDASLRGVQTLTEDQVKAIREAKAQGKSDAEGGLFYRIEALLGSEAASVKDGLYGIDPKVASELAGLVGQAKGADRYAASQWTLDGSLKQGARDTSGSDAAFTPFALPEEQKRVVEEARKLVADRKAATEAEAAVQAARDAARSDLAPAPPSAEELERLAATDTFQELPAQTDAETKRR